jgi:hypothetical protein
MALVIRDRVKETTTSTGTGTITLAGAALGFQNFSVIGDGNSTYYVIADSATGDFEVGIGTYTSSGTTLSRTTILSSSNAGSPVSFVAGIKDVFVTYPASRAVYQNEAGNATVQGDFGTINAAVANLTAAALTTGTVSTTPSGANDIANKNYVDNLVASGTHYHEPVRVESPINLNATYNNGASGVGATLTNAGTQAALVIDGVTMVVADRVLVYEQTNQTQNGVYVVTNVGSGSTNWVLTRASDADTYVVSSANGLSEGSTFFVREGVTGTGETYTCNVSGPITFGTTNITFAQISITQIYSAGTGLALTGTQFRIADTGTAGTYGSASAVPVFTTNAQGQVTAVTNTNIAISGTAVSGDIAGQAGSVANALTAGTFLTSGGTYNGSAARTFAVDATSANTASKVVARDASGNFSAGTITATLSGAATSATTATNLAGGAANRLAVQSGAGATGFVVAPTVSGQVLRWNGSSFDYVAGTISGAALGGNISTLTFGTFLTGTSYNGTGAVTLGTNATNANTASTLVARDASGNFSAGTITAALTGNATTATTAGTITSQANSATITATSANTANQIVLRDASGNFSAGTITASLSGNATTSSSTSGNAASATVLQTARTIGGVSFNGSANINLPGVNTAGNQNTTGTASNVTGTVAVGNGGTGQTTYTDGQLLIGNTTGGTLAKATLTAGTGITVTNGAGSITVAAVNNGTVTSVSGTGTVQGLTLSGTVTSSGNLTLGGSLSAVSLTTQVSGTLPIANGGTGGTTAQAAINNLAAAVTNGQYLRGNGTNVLMSAIQAADVPTLNQSTTGNAATATTLQTARTIGGVSFNGSANINLPGVNTAGNQNTTGTAANVTGTVAIANGGTGSTTAAAARTALGATTLGSNLFTVTNPSAITFPRFNANNTVSSLSAADFRTAIGAGTSSTTGTVTSVGGTGTVSGLSLSGTVTTSGNLTLGGTLAVLPSNFASQTAKTVLAAPNAAAGVPTFRLLVASDIPTLNQNTTGSAATLTTGRTIALTGDVTYTSGSFNGSANVTGAATLATVNSNVGSFGSASAVPVLTVNAKGLITAVSTAAISGGQYLGTATVKAISFNAQTIGENITVAADQNCLSAGPITINSGFTVTITSGGNWVVI